MRIFDLMKYVILITLILVSCHACKMNNDQSDKPKEKENITVSVPEVNSDSIYQYVKKQVDLGPRVPNTANHGKCAQWLHDKLAMYVSNVQVQPFSMKAYNGKTLNGKNIIARINPDKKRRILLCAHWDTRHIADSDTKDMDKPIDGADDGASGVGVLIEIARQLKLKPVNVGVDIILFDLEDYGQPSDDTQHPDMQDSWCLGAQYWSKNPHTFGYTAMYGVLLDMVGAENAQFKKEGVSMQYAKTFVDRIWNEAAKLGYSNYFIDEVMQPITDDHYYVNTIANIPTVDIINCPNTGDKLFPNHHHTHNDNMQIINKNTMKAVAQTVLTVIHKESQGAYL